MESEMKNEIPSALTFLKDWSIWLVSLQTGALGVTSFVVGKGSSLRLNTHLLKIALVWFALSIVCASFVLAALPDIALRLPHEASNNFYNMKIFDQSPYSPFSHTPLWLYTTTQHWFFIFGLFCVVMAIWGKKKSDAH
jgi:hypothetical protein